MFGRNKSLYVNVGAQVFANKEYFCNEYTNISKKFCGKDLQTFCTEFGAPEKLTFDSAKEQTKSVIDFMEIVQEYDILPHAIEPDMYNQNIVEGVIRETQKKWHRVMLKKTSPRKYGTMVYGGHVK